MAHHTVKRMSGAPGGAARASRPAAGELRRVAHTALLTMAVSLPQGILALPIALAQLGPAPGLLIIAGLGALNSLTVAWTARQLLAAEARHGAVPSLPGLAALRLGAWGRRLTVASSATLFFLALLASLVGLARSLQGLFGAPALAAGAAVGLLVLALAGGEVALSTRLLIGLGLLNLGLLVALIVPLLPHVPWPSATPPAGGSPLMMLGVSQMLFFAPMLLPTVVRQAQPRGGSARALIAGSAAGVTAGAALSGLWALAVYCAVGAAALAGASGTAVTALTLAAPATAPLAIPLGFLLLGMTALRCALVLGALVAEHLPERLRGRRRRLLAQGPAAAGVALALALLGADTASFTALIALAGGVAASLTSLVIPTLLSRGWMRPPLPGRRA